MKITNDNNGRIEIYTPYNENFIAVLKKRIGGRKWNSEKNCWTAPEESIEAVRDLMMEYFGETDISTTKKVHEKNGFTFGKHPENKFQVNDLDLPEEENKDFLREDDEPLFEPKNTENTINNTNENQEVTVDKTNDILKQINEYLDNEKKKM